MKRNSLNLNIWKYFLIFSILILIFLWVFQVLFLKNYYRYSKTKDINKVANVLVKNKSSSNLENILNKVSLEKGVCIEVIDSNYHTIYSSSFFGKGCFSGKEEKIRYKSDFVNSGVNSYTYELINPMFNNQTLVKGIKLGDNAYAFVNTSIEPIDDAINTLKNQLIIVTIIVLILSFVISYFISRRISRPIVKINKAAKNLADGNFDVVFDVDENILELNELSTTLNNTRDELEKTDELRRDLMANVSHDLKTPLTMIKAYAEMSQDLHVGNNQKQKEDMDIIVNEVDRLTLLVNDILDLSRVQSEIDTLKYSSFDIAELIKDILKRYNVLIEKENYNFIFNGPKSLVVNADKRKIEQVIYNLINNAINYTGSDNKVIINLINKDDYVLVEIVDTGKGISSKDLPYIWDKYYKNKKKHKRDLVGTGLGLAIVKNILKMHGYNYGVKSIKNKGTTFYFEIKKEKSEE